MPPIIGINLGTRNSFEAAGVNRTIVRHGGWRGPEPGQERPAAMSGGHTEGLRLSPAPVARAHAEMEPARSSRTAYAVPPRKSRPRPDV